VETSLAGKSSELKERTIGVEVFHRDPAYDTNSDPVVRVTAAEVRKRLLQYYEDPVHRSGIRIALHSGSYVPHFITDEMVESPQPAVVADIEVVTVRRKQGRVWILTVMVCLLGVATLLALWGIPSSKHGTAVDRMWGPFLHRNQNVLICVGPMPMLHPASSPSSPTPGMALLDAVQHYNIVPLADAITLSRITSLMGAHGQGFHVLNAEISIFDALQAGPSVLIGALNNQWTMRLTSKLRFQFQDSPDISRIVDRDAKHQPEWAIYRAKQYSSLIQDYAVIARYEDPTTGKMVIIAGGIGPNGTLAAGDFLTSEENLTKLFSLAPKSWKGENIEAVIRTEVINGNSGPPSVVATEFW